MEFPDLVKKYADENSLFMPIEGTLVHYRDEGEGEPLVLLHGAFSSLHTFDDWVSILKSHFRIIRLDLPGFGLTGPAANDCFTMQAYHRFVNLFLGRLGIGRCHFAGSSLGGWIVWEYALRFPKNVNRIILIDASGFLDEKSVPLPFKLARVPLAGRAVKYVVRKNILEQFVRQVYGDVSLVTPALIDRYFELFTREGNTSSFLKLVNGEMEDNSPLLSEILAPTLIMWGKNDQWLPLENAYKFNLAIPDSRLLIYDGVGHLPMEEMPERTASDALHFLQE